MFSQFLPDYRIESYIDISPEWCQQRNIKAIITDLDNTLIARKYDEPTEDLIAWSNLHKDNGIKILLLSNNKKEARVKYFSEMLDIPYIHSAGKPFLSGFHQSFSLLQMKKENCVMMGDQLSTDILGGNRAGLITILTKTQAGGDLIRTRILRWVEKIYLRCTDFFKLKKSSPK